MTDIVERLRAAAKGWGADERDAPDPPSGEGRG